MVCQCQTRPSLDAFRIATLRLALRGNGTTPNNGQVVLSGPGAGEITYWSPALNPYVMQTGTVTVTLPFDVPSNFFPPNGTGSCDGSSPCGGYQAAVLSGNLIVSADTSETISFNIGADDMAFAYLNGQVVCDLGGMHASTAGTCTTATITIGASAESIPLEVFFVDINQTQAGLIFGVNTEGIVTTSPDHRRAATWLGLLGGPRPFRARLR
jgi:fibro-slime domain-containing protein